MKYLFLVSLLTLLPAVSSQAIDKSLVLNGAAMYTEINHGYYVGGLYLEQATEDLNTILSPNQRKVMQIVITKNDWSRRSWTRHWRNRIAINNPDATDDVDGFQALGKFTKMVKDKLVRGDEILIEYRLGMSEVRVNGEVALQAKGPAVMNYLLLTWLGSIPPSTGFRKAMLNGETGAQWDTHRQLLANYNVPSDRVGLYSRWSEKDQEVQAERDRKLAALKAATELKRKELELAFSVKKRAQVEKQTRNKVVSDNAAKEKVAQGQAEKDQAETERLAKLEAQERAAEEARKLASAEQRRANERAKEQDFYRDILQWQIQRYVNNNVEYPHWAKNFAEEGLVDIRFTLDKNRDIKVLEKATDVDNMLVKEVERAIQKSVAMLTFPSQIEGNFWDININYLFSLTGESLPDAIAPVMPGHLENRQLSGPEQEELIAQYRQELVEAVQKIIVYPERAKMSRHRGRITAKITVDRWGEVKGIEMLKATRFDYLNESVTAAIEKHAPFKMLPIEVAAESIEVELSHRFH